MDLGKPKQAMVAAQKPLPVVLPKLEMPKIKGAIWKRTFVVQIDDMGALIAFIGRTPRYHALLVHNELLNRLQALARDLNGNLTDFKGITCLETPNSTSVGGPK